MDTNTISRLEHRKCFDGWYDVYHHQSAVCRSAMTFAVYLPEAAQTRLCPWLLWLSGLTCTHENFMAKAGAQRLANELGIILIAPDTSPRLGMLQSGSQPKSEDGVFGEGAGFYVNATQSPWKSHYQMFDYVNLELPSLVAANFPVDVKRCGVFGHSMGGHGALLSYFGQVHPWKSCSAFAPICKPSLSPGARRALTVYLGPDEDDWLPYDASHLVTTTKTRDVVLVDQGIADPFLKESLHLEELVAAAKSVNYPLVVRRRNEYDHSYFYVSSFIGEHMEFHAGRI